MSPEALVADGLTSQQSWKDKINVWNISFSTITSPICYLWSDAKLLNSLNWKTVETAELAETAETSETAETTENADTAKLQNWQTNKLLNC